MRKFLDFSRCLRQAVAAGLLLAAASHPAAAQQRPSHSALPALDSTKVYNYVAQMPRLPGGGGGVASIRLAIQKSLVAPGGAGTAASSGKVIVTFVVGPSGVARDIKVLDTPNPQLRSPGPAYDAAVVAAVRQLPRLLPGHQNGRPVTVQLMVPLQFGQ